MKYTPVKEFRAGSLQGYVTEPVKYSTLVKLFGKPNNGDNYKVSTEWSFDFEDGLNARIYDWKQSDLYEEGAYPVGVIRSDGYAEIQWHIGGTDPVVVDRVNEIIRNALDDQDSV